MREDRVTAGPRVLIVGPGAIAEKHVAGFRLAGAHVVGVAGRDWGRAEAFAHKLGVEHAFEGHAAALDTLGPDVVSVATPPASHAQITIDALRAGAHVLCEKPFAMTGAEADAMVAAADQSDRLLGCWSSRHQFLWGLSQAIERARAGAFGRVVHVHVDWQWRDLVPGLSYQPECPWFLDSAWNGGGVLADWGSYWIDMVLALLPDGDRPVSVLGHTFLGMDDRSAPAGLTRDAEELAMAMVTFASGASAVLQLAARVHQDTNHRMRVWGTKGGASFNPFDTSPDALFTWHDAAQGTEVLRAPGPLSMHDGPPADFVAAVRDGRPPAAPGERAARVVGITEAVYQSAREGRALNLEPG